MASFDGRQIILQGIVYFHGVGNAAGNPLAIASVASWVCLIGLLMNFRGMARFWQVMRWVVVAAGLVLTFRSGSRGQLLGLLAVGVMFMPLSRRIKSIPGFIGAVIGVVVLLGLAYWAFGEFAEGKRWTMDQMVTDYREGRIGHALLLIQAWLASGAARWIIGLGNSAAFAPFLLGGYPHFVPGEVLAEEGMVGFALYLLILILGVRTFRRAYAMVWQDPAERGRLAVLGALCTFEFILTMKQGSLIGNTAFFTYLIILGRYEAALRQELAEAAALPYDAEAAYYEGTEGHAWEPAGMEGTGMAT
jgi:hypothetical protein